MLSRQAIHIRRLRRLLGQAPGHLHQHHYQDAGAAADQGCCDHPPCRDIHLRRFFAVAVAGSKLGCAIDLVCVRASSSFWLLTDIVMCATAPRFLSLCSIQSRCPRLTAEVLLLTWPRGRPHQTLAFREALWRPGENLGSTFPQLYPTSWLQLTWTSESGRCRLALRIGDFESKLHASQGIVSASVRAEWLRCTPSAGAKRHVTTGIGSGAPHEEGRFQGGDLR